MTTPRKKAGRLNRHGRRRLHIRILLGMLLLFSVGFFFYQLWVRGMLPANQPASEWYEASQASKGLVKFPEDDTPHEQQTEWWYYSGHLRTQEGKRYSFHIALFVINRLAKFTILHGAFLDHQTGKYFTTQQRTAGKPNESPAAGGFDFRFGQWRVARTNGRDTLNVQTPEFAMQLALTSTTEPILHGETGLLDFKAAGASYYYSRPRMAVTGTAGPTGKVSPVTGEAWFDHQWGDFSVSSLGWNWFALQLADGRDVMLFDLFTPAGKKVVRYGTVSQHSLLKTLDEKDFSITATGKWQSPTTRITYPMGWKVAIPSMHLALELTPIERNCEFDGRQSSYLVYWEGPVGITGT